MISPHGHCKCAADHGRKADGRFFAELFMKHKVGKGDGDQDAHLVDGNHRADGSLLDRIVVA